MGEGPSQLMRPSSEVAKAGWVGGKYGLGGNLWLVRVGF